MARVLTRTPLNNGLTEVVVDYDGVHTVTVQLVTAMAHTLTDVELERVVADMTTTVRPTA